MMKRSKSAAEYILQSPRWATELRTLRAILRDTGLIEEIKWGTPCYTYKGKNVVGLAAFQNWVCLWFHQGALLKDRNNVLINAQEGRTKALRQWRMTSSKDIKPTVVRRYVQEATKLIDSGKEIKADRSKPEVVSPELQKALQRTKDATAAFRALSKSKQCEYADYIESAKRATTKQSRTAKIVPMIVQGIGLNDKYRC